jgi:HD-like signal output (HDOD) protein
MSRRYTASELVDNCTELGTLPEIYFRVRAVIDDPATTVASVAREISADPALTGRVLRTVNSPLFGLSGKVETVMRAVTVLGTQTVHDLVLAAAVTGAFSGATKSPLNMRQFWRMSLLTGLIARGLGKNCGLMDPERPFVEGLLSRVGMVVMAERIGALMAVVTRHALNTGSPRHQAETAFIGCDYAQTGAELLRRWSLPVSIVTSVERHLKPSLDDPMEILILHAAAVVAARYETGPVSRQRAIAMDPAILARLEVDTYILEAAGERGIADLSATEEIMFPARSKAA